MQVFAHSTYLNYSEEFSAGLYLNRANLTLGELSNIFEKRPRSGFFPAGVNKIS
jgi:hypothetical protein